MNEPYLLPCFLVVVLVLGPQRPLLAVGVAGVLLGELVELRPRPPSLPLHWQLQVLATALEGESPVKFGFHSDQHHGQGYLYHLGAGYYCT